MTTKSNLELVKNHSPQKNVTVSAAAAKGRRPSLLQRVARRVSVSVSSKIYGDSKIAGIKDNNQAAHNDSGKIYVLKM